MRPIESPSGIDIKPKPRTSAKVSRRAGIIFGGIAACGLGAVAWGAHVRAARNDELSRASMPGSSSASSLVPAVDSASSVARDIPAGNSMLVAPAGALSGRNQTPTSGVQCGSDPRTGQPYRFDPQTGQACAAEFPLLPPAMQASTPAPVGAPLAVDEMASFKKPLAASPQDAARIAAYEREQDAIKAPLRGNSISAAPSIAGSASPLDDLTRLAALASGSRGAQPPAPAQASAETDFDAQNAQSAKEAFLHDARKGKTGDYLASTRTAPLSAYEIKAGWEIPAVLEQELNSDLPGELKALVASNVYDTATGRYLLIPQGARIVGNYNSKVTFGQDGVQVEWSRLIYPDASSIDLDGMLGLDSHGNAGLRDKVDRHYKRLIGMTALSSIFAASAAVAQRQNQSLLAYPSGGQLAGSAAANEVTQTGSQITRRNLNVQPTIKVPQGYKFTVRVNRDILFESPYTPSGADPMLRRDSRRRLQ